MNYLDYILDYLNGDLSSEDSSQFERDLLKNNELMSELEEVLNLRDTIREEMEFVKEYFPSDDFGEDSFNLLDAVYGIDSTTGEILPEKYSLVSDLPRMADRYAIKKVNNHRGKWFMAAAALVIAALMTTILPEIVINRCSNDEIFKRFHEPIPLSVSRSAGKQTDQAYYLEKIRKLFNSGDYAGVTSIVGEISDPMSLDTDYILAIGMSFQMSGEYQKAIMFFKSISNNTLYYYPALWELSLTSLKAGDTEEAIEVMNTLRQMDPLYEKRIRKIIRCIKAGRIAGSISLLKDYKSESLN